MGCRARTSIALVSSVVALTIASACGGTSFTGPSAGKAQRSLTVMTFNIQHGLDASGRYNLQGAVDVIARLQPDVVALQEVTRNHPSYNCDDQPAVIADGLERATGRGWSRVYVREWFTPDRTCLDRGTGTEVETEGLALLAVDALGSSQNIPLPLSRLGLVARGVANVPVVVTQLASGTAAIADRSAQLAQLLPWTATQGIPRILVGDFNARPGSIELEPLAADYRDAWTDAGAQGTARGVMTGDTLVKGGRIDYVFYAGEGLAVESAEIVDTAILLGARTEVSDHRPVLVRFTIR